MANYEPGSYVAEVVEQGWQETKKDPPRPMIVLQFQPVAKIKTGPDGERYRDPVAPAEYPQTIRILVDANNEQAMDFAVKKLRYAGFTGKSFAEFNLVGKEIEVHNDPKEYEGKLRDQWDLALPPREINPLDSKATRRLDTLFDRRLKETAEEPARPAAQPAQPAWTPTEQPQVEGLPDSEIPF